jgi:hypothetical protein
MMMDDPPFERDRALFAQWRAAAAEPMASAPDALLLAAYAEGRLTEAEAAPVEAALAADPALLDTLLALRQPAEPAQPSTMSIQAAQALVAGQSDPVVVPFRRRAAGLGRFSGGLAWAAVAASLLLVSMVGFDLGVRTEHVVNATASADSPSDLLDPFSLSGDDIG